MVNILTDSIQNLSTTRQKKRIWCPISDDWSNMPLLTTLKALVTTLIGGQMRMRIVLYRVQAVFSILNNFHQLLTFLCLSVDISHITQNKYRESQDDRNFNLHYYYLYYKVFFNANKKDWKGEQKRILKSQMITTSQLYSYSNKFFA